MLAIGRALMSRPSILLLDEPSLGLAPRVVRQLGETLRKLLGVVKGVLLVEQDVGLSVHVADFVYVMQNGRIAHAAPADQVATNELVREIYLGR